VSRRYGRLLSPMDGFGEEEIMKIAIKVDSRIDGEKLVEDLKSSFYETQGGYTLSEYFPIVLILGNKRIILRFEDNAKIENLSDRTKASFNLTSIRMI